MGAACGIDFGTSNSAVALPSGEVLPIDAVAPDPRLFRSVLFFPDGQRDVLAGENAIVEYLDNGEGRFIQSVKSWLASRTFTATQIRGRTLRLEDLVAMLLRRIRELASAKAGTPLDRVVLGRPARFSTEDEADARAETRLLEAARIAGFSSVRLLIEPIAAALAYEAELTRDELVLVADFGAGTSDLTLMRLGPSGRDRADRRGDVLASDGVTIGGDKFDAAIMRHKLLPYFGAGSTYVVQDKRLAMPTHILNKLLSWHEMSFIREKSTQEVIDRMLRSSDRLPAIEALFDLVMENLGYRLFRAIEKVKVQLSTVESAEIVFDEARVQIKETVTRCEFERFSQPLLDALAACVDGLFAKTGIERRTVDAVFLTGGSSQIPAVRRIFEDRFGEARLRSANAFTSVAAGLGRGSHFLVEN
jgi:hypothetical chaperone protein